jgi:hypothetical protein
VISGDVINEGVMSGDCDAISGNVIDCDDIDVDIIAGEWRRDRWL